MDEPVTIIEKEFLFQIAVGTVCLSVRLLTTLGTGDLNCIILAVQMSGNQTQGGLISELRSYNNR